MPNLTIGPDQFVTAEYRLRRKGFVDLNLEASHRVKTYLLSRASLQRFMNGQRNFPYWGGFPDPRALQEQRVWVPASGPLYLIFRTRTNRSP
jgi:hypothetical protein